MGKNIKQLTKRTSLALTDLFYIVASDTDYVTDFESLKTLFNLDEFETWNTDNLTYNSTNYIDTLADSTEYGVIKIEYIAKRGSRSYRSGLLTVMYDSSQVVYNDYWDVTNNDNDDLGLTITAQLSASNFQLVLDVDGSDTNNLTFNWKITVKKPLAV